MEGKIFIINIKLTFILGFVTSDMFDDLTLSDFDDCTSAHNQNHESLGPIQKSVSLNAIPYLHESDEYHSNR